MSGARFLAPLFVRSFLLQTAAGRTILEPTKPYCHREGERFTMDLLKKFLGRKKQERAAPFCTAVIVAAGTASRMQGIDKILCPMGNYPLLLYTLIPFQNSDSVDEIVIVTREDLMLPIGDLCRREGMHKVTRIVKGGASRTESVLEGLHAADPKTDLVAIHDGARPFLPPEVLEHTIETARTRGAAAPAIPVKDTIKVAKDGVVQATPDRSALFAVQTPQVFEIGLIQGALAHALEEGAVLTDDCSAVERIGFPVCLTQGSEDNLKITTPRDLTWGEAILAERMR